nr:twin-arginine translocation signal domain-containing protein [Candidatus Omnitrophota bacterium]
MNTKNHITRRDFLKILAATGLGIAASNLFFKPDFSNAYALTDIGYSHEAMFYEKLDTETIKCLLCPHECVLKNGQRSFCRVREPKNGKLYSLVYELACAVHI